MRAAPPVLLRPLAGLGAVAIRLIAGFGRFGGFLAETVRALQDVSTWAPLLMLHMRRLGVDSLPIALFLSAFTGIVLALQASYTFTGAIPLYFVGTLVGKTMILELGPVLTGLALAGRVGANIAAQLGTMRVSEQIDALETLAYNPVAYLVVPRVLAGVLMFPIIVIFSNTIGIIAGLITAVNMLEMSPQEFIRGLRLFYMPFDLTYSLIKTTSFGLLITIVGCYQGFMTEGGAEGVGIATTRAVVISSMLILLFDAFWAVVLLRMIELLDIHKAFGPKKVLQGFSLRVEEGSTTSLVGFSGAGKSVTLKHIVGLLEPDSGSVRVDEQEVVGLGREKLYELRRQVGYVFQFAALFDSMTIAENLAMGLIKQGGYSEAQIRERIDESLKLVELEGFETRFPSELSGGQRKRAGLARAIAFRPKYLLYDEPTSGLDPVTTTVIDRLIMKMKKELGVTSLVITHDMESAYRISDRIAMLYDGRVLEEGLPDEIRQTKNPVVKGFVEGKPELVEAGVEGGSG